MNKRYKDGIKMMSKQMEPLISMVSRIKPNNYVLEIEGNRISILRCLALLECNLMHSNSISDEKDISWRIGIDTMIQRLRNWASSNKVNKDCCFEYGGDYKKVFNRGNGQQKLVEVCETLGPFYTDTIQEYYEALRLESITNKSIKPIIGTELLICMAYGAVMNSPKVPNITQFVSSLIVYWAKDYVDSNIVFKYTATMDMGKDTRPMYCDGGYGEWCKYRFGEAIGNMYYALAQKYSPYIGSLTQLAVILDEFVNYSIQAVDETFISLLSAEDGEKCDTEIALVNDVYSSMLSIEKLNTGSYITYDYFANELNGADDMVRGANNTEDDDSTISIEEMDEQIKQKFGKISDAVDRVTLGFVVLTQKMMAEKIGKIVEESGCSLSDAYRLAFSVDKDSWGKYYSEKTKKDLYRLYDPDIDIKKFSGENKDFVGVYKRTTSRFNILFIPSKSRIPAFKDETERDIPLCWLLGAQNLVRCIMYNVVCGSYYYKTRINKLDEFGLLNYIIYLDSIGEIDRGVAYNILMCATSGYINKYISFMYSDLFTVRDRTAIAYKEYNDKLQLRVKSLESKIDELTKKAEKLRSERRELGKKAKSLDKDIKTLKTRNEQLDKLPEIQEAHREAEKLRAERDKLKQTVESLSDELITLRRQSASITKEISSKDSEIKALNDSNSDLSEKLEAAQSKMEQSEISKYLADIEIEAFINAIKERRIILVGGDMLFDRIRSYGLDNIKMYDAGFCKFTSLDLVKCELVVICTVYVSHKSTYSITNLAKSSGTPIMHFNNKNVDMLIYRLFEYFYSN